MTQTVRLKLGSGTVPIHGVSQQSAQEEIRCHADLADVVVAHNARHERRKAQIGRVADLPFRRSRPAHGGHNACQASTKLQARAYLHAEDAPHPNNCRLCMMERHAWCRRSPGVTWRSRPG